MAPSMKPTSSSLMPPPRVAASNLRALPTSSHTIRVPTTGPLPNRGPIPNRGPLASQGSLGLPSSGRSFVNTPNARGKVLLSPGHSPLDWATLQKSGKNLSGVDTLMRVTPTMLKEKNGRKGKPAWSSYQGKVYNISPYLPFHPGGEGELRRVAGKDGTKLFMEVHPWVNWENMLGECMVGILVSQDQPSAGTGGSLEDMD
ncbi:cytochrome b5-like heme/steroid binding domain-containing protein [Phaeosphaeriaceae sp. PMI808]|nr:cytochrome b5-like heme/steroid binding domain-containing protein [Phaeosphaeriaceae sp. PMI808]